MILRFVPLPCSVHIQLQATDFPRTAMPYSCSYDRNGVRAEATLTGGRPMEGAVTASPAPEQAAEVRCSPPSVAMQVALPASSLVFVNCLCVLVVNTGIVRF